MVAASLLTTLLLALAIANASKPVLKRNPLMKSRQRYRTPINIPAVYNRIYFTVDVSVGDSDPPTSYNLILISGTANTWVGTNPANRYKNGTNTSQPTGNSVNMTYGKLPFNGVEYKDQVTIGSDSSLVIYNQSISAPYAAGLNYFDGFLGIGPSDLSIGTLFPDNTSSIPTVTDNLFTSGVITESLVAVYFQPYNFSNPRGTFDAEITWGGIDQSLYIGDITYVNITSRSQAKKFWAIDVASVTYGSSLLLSNAVGHVDTGSTFVYLAPDAFDKYRSAIGAIIDDRNQFLTIEPGRFKDLQNLTLSIAGVNFTLTPDAQVYDSRSVLQGQPNRIYLTISQLGSNSSRLGFDLVIGQVFLERFYSVYDTGNKRVGLAQTNCTYATFNNNTQLG